MGSSFLKWLFGIIFVIHIQIFGSLFASEKKQQIPYLIHTGHLGQALSLYRADRKSGKSHDSSLLKQIGLQVLLKGSKSREPEHLVSVLFGAGISGSDEARIFLTQAIESPYPQLQLIALSFLGREMSDDADDALCRAMASDFLPIRLEAAFHLSVRKHPRAVPYLDALLSKYDEKLQIFLPSLYAKIGTKEATRSLKKLLAHGSTDVRVASILSCVENDRDDLLCELRRLSSHHNVSQREACAYAFGELKDETMLPELKKWCNSPSLPIQVASLKACYKLGEIAAWKCLAALAESGNILAITALEHVPEAVPILKELLNAENFSIRLHACLSLLAQGEGCMLSVLKEILITDQRDIAFSQVSSTGKTLHAWRPVPSAEENLKDDPIIMELSLNLREAILRKIPSISQTQFLILAESLFENEQKDLLPTLIGLLETLNSTQSVALLKKYSQKMGSPFTRHACTLSLYRLKEPGPYAEVLRQWVLSQANNDLTDFRTLVPSYSRIDSTPHQLTPREQTRLLLETYEAFTTARDAEGIDLLLECLEKGHVSQKYILAGLLMRASY